MKDEDIEKIAQFVENGSRVEDYAKLLQQRAELLKALKRYVADSCEHDVGGGDVVVSTCESREMAVSVIAKMEQTK